MSQDQLHIENYFPASVYTINKPEYTDLLKAVAPEYLAQVKDNLVPLYPVLQTGPLDNDERLIDFGAYIRGTAHNILISQGANMNGLNPIFHELWIHEHQKTSNMEQHVHGFGAQIVGFYFFDVPDNSCQVVIHDPRTGHTLTKLPEATPESITYSSSMITFQPKEGLFLFTNSWLPHSFTRNGSDKPMRFVHFTIGVAIQHNDLIPIVDENLVLATANINDVTII